MAGLGEKVKPLLIPSIYRPLFFHISIIFSCAMGSFVSFSLWAIPLRDYK